MDKFFSAFGKLVVILLVIGVLLGGGYYLGKKYGMVPSSSQPNTQVTTVPTNTIAATGSVSPTVSQQQADPHVAIYGGGINPFNKYLMSGFKSWTKTVDHTNAMDKLTLTSGDYQLVILQAALGGGGCTFPGDQPQAMSVPLSNPVVQIPLLDGTFLKRGQADSGTNPGKATYTVCQQSQGGYSTLTSFGVITYTVPLNPDQQTVAMMDAMVGSLQKQ